MHKSFGNCTEGDLYVVCGFLREADEFVPILEGTEEWSDPWIAILTTTPVESIRMGRREPGTTVRRLAICKAGKCDEMGMVECCLIGSKQAQVQITRRIVGESRNHARAHTGRVRGMPRVEGGKEGRKSRGRGSIRREITGEEGEPFIWDLACHVHCVSLDPYANERHIPPS